MNFIHKLMKNKQPKHTFFWNSTNTINLSQKTQTEKWYNNRAGHLHIHIEGKIQRGPPEALLFERSTNNHIHITLNNSYSESFRLTIFSLYKHGDSILYNLKSMPIFNSHTAPFRISLFTWAKDIYVNLTSLSLLTVFE